MEKPLGLYYGKKLIETFEPEPTYEEIFAATEHYIKALPQYKSDIDLLPPSHNVLGIAPDWRKVHGSFKNTDDQDEAFVLELIDMRRYTIS